MTREQKTKAFTLVELLVIIGIFAILMLLSAPVFRYFQSESDLINASEQVISVLRLAQSQTITSEGGSQYGVYFPSPNQYLLFKGSGYSSRDPASDKVYFLPETITIYAVNLGVENEVVFDKIDGETADEGSISLRLANRPEETKTIYIKNSGQVNLVDVPSPSDTNRIKDSRHYHFNLGWSIQNATNLKFYFPSTLQTETVSLENYFNVDKTVFNWNGTFLVAGANQTFRIHTHSLDAFNTLLCIHRDRNNGNNNQEVIIYIQDITDKDIAHYLADSQDTLEKGTFVNSIERQ